MSTQIDAVFVTWFDAEVKRSYGDSRVLKGKCYEKTVTGVTAYFNKKGKEWKPFKYKDLGSLATIGRNKAVAEIGKARFKGFGAWILWLVVHLYSLLGVKNKFFVFINWVWNYLTYDQSLRLIIKATNKNRYKSKD